MNLAGQTTLGEILPIQASRVDLATKPALYFNVQTYTYAELHAASARARATPRARVDVATKWTLFCTGQTYTYAELDAACARAAANLRAHSIRESDSVALIL